MAGILDIASAILRPISDYFQRRKELEVEQHKADLEIVRAQGERQAQLAKDGLAADAAWEMEFARQAGNSWKDEYELLLLSIPMIMCFVPGWDVYVANGFASLSKTPLWFQSLLVTIFLANYGIRNYRRTISDT
jgi:hypothetical protein